MNIILKIEKLNALRFNVACMKKKEHLFIIVTLVFVGLVFSNVIFGENKYQRKAISSPGEVLIFSENPIWVTTQEAKQILDQYLKIDRFDINTLPEHVSRSFIESVYKKRLEENISEENLIQLIEKYFAKEIQQILEHPEVQKSRISQFKDRSVFNFEFGKGQGYSVTAKDLEKLYASSYIYIPYISDVRFSKKIVKKKQDDELMKRISKWKIVQNVSVGVDAGILWYHIQVLPNQSIQVKQIKNIVARGYQVNEGSINEDTEKLAKKTMENCLNEIGNIVRHETKKIKDFKLLAQIDSINKGRYVLNISDIEGVNINDYFWVMEDYESKKEVKSKKVGLLFVSDLMSSQTGESKAKGKQVYGSWNHLGSWAEEAPRYGININIMAQYKTGFLLDSRDIPFLENNVSEAKAVSGRVSMPLNSIINSKIGAVIPNKKQKNMQKYGDVFLDVEGSLTNVDILEWLYDAYIGIRKVYWVRHTSVQPFFQVGNHRFFVGTIGDDLDFDMTATALKAGVSIEKMLYPFISISGSVFATKSLGKPYIHNLDKAARYSKLNWYGVTFGVTWLN